MKAEASSGVKQPQLRRFVERLALMSGVFAVMSCSPTSPTQANALGMEGRNTSQGGADSALPPPAAQGGVAGAASAGGSSLAGLGGSGTLTRPADLGKFEPPAGHTLLVIGQDPKMQLDYVKASGSVPAGFMTYSQINERMGFTDPRFSNPPPSSGDVPENRRDFFRWADGFPNIVVQDGMWMTGTITPEDLLIRTENGEFDGLLRERAQYYKQGNVPVFLRVDYEIEGHFPYQHYLGAFKRVHDIISAIAPNVAFVWHVTYNRPNPAYADWDQHELWWPGDDLVDWIGISMFGELFRTHEADGTAIDDNARLDQKQLYGANLSRLLEFAHTKHKPVMLAESTPMISMETPLGRRSWDMWFEHVFDFIEQNDIKLFSYINEDWQYYEWDYPHSAASPPRVDFEGIYAGRLVAKPYCDRFVSGAAGGCRVWGDSRVESSPEVWSRWLAKLREPRYLQASPELYKFLGFQPDPAEKRLDYSKFSSGDGVTYGVDETSHLGLSFWYAPGTPTDDVVLDYECSDGRSGGARMFYNRDRSRFELPLWVDGGVSVTFSFRPETARHIHVKH